MYAIIEACGRQYKVSEGDKVFFEKLETEEGKKVVFDKVIFCSDDKTIKIGDPYLKDVKVEGKVLSHGKWKKVIIFKMRPKKHYRKKQGHRQAFTKVEITDIKIGTATKAEKAEKPAEAEKKETKTTKPVAKKTVAKTETKTVEKTAAKKSAAKTATKTTATKTKTAKAKTEKKEDKK